MLNPLNFISKPEYVLRPSQILQRFMRIGKSVPGFAIFELHETWLKPRLSPLQTSKSPVRPAFSYNYLATLDAGRAQERFRSLGWHCLLNI
jgi:hypothetical protein